MKKFALACGFILLACASYAQSNFGIKGGANLANLRLSANGLSLSYSSRLGAHGGFFATIPVSTNFRVQPEAVFSMEGAEYEESQIRLNYVNIPLMFQYHAAGFYGETGPQVGLLVSASAQEDNIVEDVRESFESVSILWGVGAGYRLQNGLGFGARYTLGLSNIIKDADSEDGTVKSNVFQFGLSYTFGRSGK